MSPIQWADQAPRGDDPPPPPKVVYLSPNNSFLVRIVARPVGVWLHWLDAAKCPPKGRSLPCKGPECPPERHAESKKLYHYVATLFLMGQEQRRWYKRVLLLNEQMYQQLADLDPSQGILATAFRPAGSFSLAQFRNLKYPDLVHSQDGRNEPFDVVPSLLYVWGEPAEGSAAAVDNDQGEPIIRFPDRAPPAEPAVSKPIRKPKENA